MLSSPIKGFLFLTTATIVPLFFALSVAPSQSNVLAAMFPPWWSDAEIMASAAEAGFPLKLGAARWILLVRRREADLRARLHAAGALFVFDPSVSTICGHQ